MNGRHKKILRVEVGKWIGKPNHPVQFEAITGISWDGSTYYVGTERGLYRLSRLKAEKVSLQNSGELLRNLILKLFRKKSGLIGKISCLSER